MKTYQKPETVNVNIEGADLMQETTPMSKVGNPSSVDEEQGVGGPTAPKMV